MTISELKSKKSETIKETRAIIQNAQVEKREMTKEEQEMFDNNLIEIENLKAQISQLQDKLLETVTETKSEEPKEEPKEETTEEPKEETPNEETEEETQEEEKSDNTDEEEEEKTDESEEETQEENTENEDSDEEKINNKIKRNHINMNNYITREIRNAIENGTNKFNLPISTRAVQVTGSNGVHDHVIETEIKGIFEPLFADSIIAKLGTTYYSEMPMEDVRVPVMSAGNADWATELGTATTNNPTFTSVLLQPKRISAVLPYSKNIILQDTVGIEDALRKALYETLMAKVQETFLGDAAGSTTKPAGIFYNVDSNDIESYEDLCDAEAKVADSNVGGEMKYLMSNKAKAVVRTMAKSAMHTELVLTGGKDIDGTEVIASSQVPDNMYAFGNFKNIIFCQFGKDLDIVIDPYSLAAENQIRIIVTGWFDWKKVRADQDVIVYGEISRPEDTTTNP